VVADVYGKLNKVRTALDSLAAKVDQRQNRLQNVLLQSQEFQVSFEDFLNKLAKVEDQVARLEPVSGIHETAKEQTQEHKVMLEVNQHLQLYVV
jgi:DNA repair ATPase RecN